MFGFGGYFGHTIGEVHRDLGVVIKIDSSEHQVSSDTVQIVRSRTIAIDSSLHIVSSTEVIVLYAPRWRDDADIPTPWEGNQSIPNGWMPMPEASTADWQGSNKHPQEWDQSIPVAHTWQPGEEREHTPWNDPAGGDQSSWTDANNSQPQQWSEDNSKQPAHWQQ